MDDKKKTKLQNRVKEIESILDNNRDYKKIDSHSLIMERSEIQFKLNSENIHFQLRDERTKYYYASQCRLFLENLLILTMLELLLEIKKELSSYPPCKVCLII